MKNEHDESAIDESAIDESAITAAIEIQCSILGGWLEKFRGYTCHNPMLRSDADGCVWVAPSSDLVPLDEGEDETNLDCLGDLDPDDDIRQLAARLDRSCYDLEYVAQKHPRLWEKIEGTIDEQLREFGEGCMDWLRECAAPCA